MSARWPGGDTAGVLTLLLCFCTSTLAAAELAADPERDLVIASCTACHSADLITQNRMNRSGWEKTIRWMQKHHGLWDLGPYEPRVLDYLATHYNVPANLSGRRQPLNQPPLP
ncbi:MAG: hypothetical protein ACFHX7_08780 [Pseudomonadota bacterium]